MQPEILDVAKLAAIESSKVILSSYGKITELLNKNPNDVKDYVTNVDKEAEKVIRKVVFDSFPEHSVLGEEEGLKQTQSEYKWIIDPIDGTKNFVHRLGQFCTSIGVTKNGLPYLGVIADPIDGTIISAVVGKGVHINKGTVGLSSNKLLNSASIAINLGKTLEIRNRSLAILTELLTIVPTLRTPGSTAYVLKEMTQGKYDALVDNGDFWDFAAGLVILTELGGHVMTWEGETVREGSKYVLWTNGVIDTEMQPIIKKHS